MASGKDAVWTAISRRAIRGASVVAGMVRRVHNEAGASPGTAEPTPRSGIML
jgi:hypothetical protein